MVKDANFELCFRLTHSPGQKPRPATISPSAALDIMIGADRGTGCHITLSHYQWQRIKMNCYDVVHAQGRSVNSILRNRRW